MLFEFTLIASPISDPSVYVLRHPQGPLFGVGLEGGKRNAKQTTSKIAMPLNANRRKMVSNRHYYCFLPWYKSSYNRREKPGVQTWEAHPWHPRRESSIGNSGWLLQLPVSLHQILWMPSLMMLSLFLFALLLRGLRMPSVLPGALWSRNSIVFLIQFLLDACKTLI